MKTVTLLTTAFVSATLIGGPAMAKSSSGQFDVDATTSNYRAQELLSKTKDSISNAITISHKATIAVKPRLSDVMIKDSLVAQRNTNMQILKPRTHLSSKPRLQQIK